MGVPWNPEWDERIMQLVRRGAALEIEAALADGRTMSQITPESIPTISSTATAVQSAVDTGASQTNFSATTGAWRSLSPPISRTVKHGGRPVLLIFSGGVAIQNADTVSMSMSIDGREVTNTTYGLTPPLPTGGAWYQTTLAWLHQPKAPGAFSVEVVGKRAANTGYAIVSTSTVVSTLIAVEV